MARNRALYAVLATALLVSAVGPERFNFFAHASSVAQQASSSRVMDEGTPPIAALRAGGTPSSGEHAMGLALPPMPVQSTLVRQQAPQVGTTTYPTSFDISANAPPVGNQGQVNSCASWAIGYYMRGYYANRNGTYPAGGFAPMYIYSQATGGTNTGTTLAGNLSLLKSQGIDTEADYTQGYYNYSTLPTAAETANASAYRIASFQDYYPLTGAQTLIEQQLSAGDPVVLAIQVNKSFDNASSSSPLVQPGGSPLGGHAVIALKYDAAGVWIENSWGTSWGLNGWAELSWSFINNAAWTVEAASMVVSSTPLPTFTPGLPSGTATALTRVSATPAAYNTAIAKLTAVVVNKTATAEAKYTATLRANVTAVARLTITATTAAANASATASAIAAKTTAALAAVASAPKAYQTAVARVTAAAVSTAAAAPLATRAAIARWQPAIVAVRPINMTVPVSSTVSLYAAARGNPAPDIQWQVNSGGGWIDVDPNTYTLAADANNTLTFVAQSSQDGYKFRAMLSNGAGGVVTAPISLKVTGGATPTVTPTAIPTATP